MQMRALVGLIGNNIMLSLSPALHEDAFAAAGMAGYYHLMDLARLKGRRLAEMFQAVRAVGFAGVNITHPYKEAILPLLDEVSADARAIGAVNTVVIDGGGRSFGYNTDRPGFSRAFAETLGIDAVAGKTVALIGAGGAGRAVAFALKDIGAGHLHIHDKDQARATALCADLMVHFGAQSCAVAVDPVRAVDGAAGIVNATPIGMIGYSGLPIAANLVRKEQWVSDVIYTPIETEFLAVARGKGCRVMNGAGMCVHQAAESFRLFTGVNPDVARMHRTFAAACDRRDAALAAAS